MRAMVWSYQWSGGHPWRGRHHRYGWPATLVLAPPLVLGLGVAAVAVLAVGLAVLATLAALVFSVAVTAGIFGALGFVAWQLLRHTVPGLAVPRKRGKRSGKRDARESSSAASPVDLLRRRYAAGEIGQTAFRQQLTNLLKERYVRGDLTLAEFESRVRYLYRDPVLQPPRA